MGCGKLDLHKRDYSWGLDGRGSMEAWGFSDMVDNGGKGGAATAYRRDPVGPKDPYFAYLDSLEPPLGKLWADEIGRLAKSNGIRSTIEWILTNSENCSAKRLGGEKRSRCRFPTKRIATTGSRATVSSFSSERRMKSPGIWC